MATGADNLDSGVLLNVEGLTATTCMHQSLLLLHFHVDIVLTSPLCELQRPAREHFGRHGCCKLIVELSRRLMRAVVESQ